jgi:hypothetical protein
MIWISAGVGVTNFSLTELINTNPFAMKIRVLFFLVFMYVATACTQYSCPTYGNHYVYTGKQKSRSPGKSKPVKRAEQ